MSGYFSEAGKPVTWRGLKAVYATDERDIMRALPVREQAVIHLLKAFTHGEIRGEVPDGATTVGLGTGEMVPVGASSAQRKPGVTSLATTTYIDAEDIEFGPPPPRKRPIYALVWTWKQSRVHKTKKRCQEKQRAWKKWYERQGWKVTNHGAGYFATSPQGERHSISLHEYDAETKERLK